MNNFSFTKNRAKFFIFSAICIVIGICLLVFKGFNWDVDFVGGTEITIKIGQTVDKSVQQDIEDIVKPMLGDKFSSLISTGNNKDEILIRSNEISSEERAAVFNAVAEKYKRRIERFYQNIRTKPRVLLVWFSHYHDTTNEQWARFANDFCNKMNKNIDFLIIQHLENQHTPIKTIIAPNIVRYDLHTIEKDTHGNNTTVGNEKLCDTIFSQYELRVPRERRLKYFWKQCLLNGVCKFVPLHDVRHAWRAKLKRDMNDLIYNRLN